MNSETFTKNIIELQSQIKKLQHEEMIKELNSFAKGDWKLEQVHCDLYYTMHYNNKTLTYFPDTNSFYISARNSDLLSVNIAPEDFKKEYKKLITENFK